MSEGGMTVDLSKRTPHISKFANGPVELTVKKARQKQSSKNKPMIELVFDCYHPHYGHAELKDNLPIGFLDKIYAYWQAVYDLSDAEMEKPENKMVRLIPSRMIGQRCLGELGEEEGTNKAGAKVMYKRLAPPWYYPLSMMKEKMPQPDYQESENVPEEEGIEEEWED